MAKQPKLILRYSISFKQKVVKEIEQEGLSYTDAMRRYGITGGATIRKWMIRFGKNDLLNKVVRVEMKGETDRVKQLEAEVQKLKIALADATLAKGALETLIDIVNEHYQTDVKKFRTAAIGQASEQKGYSIKELCFYFDYCPSSYYKSLRVEATEMLQEEIIVELVNGIRCYQPNIGGKKLYHLLKEDLHKLDGNIGRDKLFDILRKHGLLVKRKKKYAYTTDSFHRFRVYKNALKNKLLTGPNQACVSDITYLRIKSGFVYLFLITDAYSRKITGWSLSNSLSIEGGLKALKMAIKQCSDTTALIHHSDRGIQYCSNEYVALLKLNEMTISMTEENHCYENAIAERVNGILKQDFLLDETFKNILIAQSAVKEAIETYNTRRPHWSLKLCTPEQVHNAA